MATFNANASVRMDITQVSSGTLVDFSPTRFVVAAGQDTSVYIGNFTYYGGYVFGTIREYREYFGSFLEGTITGLNIDTQVANAFLFDGQVQQLFALAFTGNDTFNGSTFDDVLIGYTGNDFFRPSRGFDVIDGGPGFDIVEINDSISFINRTTLNNGVRQIVSADETDLLVNVERVYLYDGIVAYDILGNAGNAYRLYQAAFDRTPDQPGLSYWVNQMDDGMLLSQVALNFILSPEFTATYGNINAMTNAQFINVVYENVLDRSPDILGFNYWMNDLANGYPRHFMLAAFSQSAENQANVIGQISNGIALDLAPFL